MESKHETQTPTSPSPYVEAYRGFTLTLEFTAAGTVRAVATGDVIWLTPFGRSWITQLERIRGLVDRYLEALATCARITERSQLAAGAGAVELPAVHPVVRS